MTVEECYRKPKARLNCRRNVLENHTGQRKGWLLHAKKKKGFNGQFCRPGFFTPKEEAVLTQGAQLALGVG